MVDLKIVKCRNIVRNGHSVKENISREEYFETKWIEATNLLDWINEQSDKGNLDGEKGFSPAICLSDLIKILIKKIR
jgi:hypothetical protein